jgi:hypothetical protein
MAIDTNPTPDELQQLHDDLKSYEVQLAAYLDSATGQGDPNFSALAKADIQLNLQIYNLSITQLQLVGDNVGTAVDAINAAVGSLTAAVAARAKVATALGAVQAAVAFVVALLSENPTTIISAGGTLVSALKAV